MEIVMSENIKIEQFIHMILRDYIKLLQENIQLKVQIEEYQKALDETMSEKMDIENNLIRKNDKEN